MDPCIVDSCDGAKGIGQDAFLKTFQDGSPLSCGSAKLLFFHGELESHLKGEASLHQGGSRPVAILVSDQNHGSFLIDVAADACFRQSHLQPSQFGQVQWVAVEREPLGLHFGEDGGCHQDGKEKEEVSL